MDSIILVIHLMVAVAMIGTVLLQRSEGGALGIGGGSGGGGLGGLMTGRGAANVLTRTTAYLAAAFFATSITLSLYGHGGDGSVLDAIDVNTTGGGAVETTLPLGDERKPEPAAPGAPPAAAPPVPAPGPSVPQTE